MVAKQINAMEANLSHMIFKLVKCKEMQLLILKQRLEQPTQLSQFDSMVEAFHRRHVNR